MNRREKLQDAYEDALFALLMEDVIEEEGERLSLENERLKNDPSAAVPEELHERCRRTIYRAFGQRRRKETGRKTGRIIYRAFSKAAAVAVICMMLFGVAYAVSPTLRVKTLNLLIEISDVKTILSVESEDKPQGSYDTSEAAQAVYEQYGYRIPEMPEGFELIEEIAANITATLKYENADKASVVFKFTKTIGGEYRVDTESAQRVEDITVGGFDGLLVVKDSRIQIAWGNANQNVFVSVVGAGVDEELLWDIVNAMAADMQ